MAGTLSRRAEEVDLRAAYRPRDGPISPSCRIRDACCTGAYALPRILTRGLCGGRRACVPLFRIRPLPGCAVAATQGQLTAHLVGWSEPPDLASTRIPVEKSGVSCV